MALDEVTIIVVTSERSFSTSIISISKRGKHMVLTE
jgi:hypothetical protein